MRLANLIALITVASVCWLFAARLHAQRVDLELRKVRPALQLSDDSVLVCQAGGLLGGGGGQKEAEVEIIPVNGHERREVIVEFVTRVDRNRDRQLDHRELLSLDLTTRQRMLDELDSNRDRKLQRSEIEAAIVASDPALDDYPRHEQPPAPPTQPEAFRNLRRFGIGLPQTPPTTRSQPFARAATHGSAPSFRRVVTKREIDGRIQPSSRGRCSVTFQRAR